MKLNKLLRLIHFLDIKAVISYLSVGGISALIYFSIFTILWEFVVVNYQFAITVGYICSVCFHFFANRRFSFKAHSFHMTDQLRRYLIMIGINYLMTMFIAHFVVNTLLLSPYMGILASIASTVGVGYLMAKFWVFRHPVGKKKI